MTNQVGMTSSPVRHRWRVLLSTFVVVAALGIVGSGSVADAGDQCDSGDPRATCVTGNATTCASAGITAPNELTEQSGTQSDGNVTGTVSGDGTLLNVTVDNPEFAIIAVIVKGGDNYNLYNSNVPDMHAPLVGGGNIPEISHWTICYGPAPDEPPPDQAPDAVEQAPAVQGVVAAQPQFTG